MFVLFIWNGIFNWKIPWSARALFKLDIYSYKGKESKKWKLQLLLPPQKNTSAEKESPCQFRNAMFEGRMGLISNASPRPAMNRDNSLICEKYRAPFNELTFIISHQCRQTLEGSKYNRFFALTGCYFIGWRFFNSCIHRALEKILKIIKLHLY